MAERPTNQEDTIQESVSTRAIEALISNYRDAQQAFLELIDNAVDNRTDNTPLVIRIRVSKNELTVTNQGGRGLDRAGLSNFFVWGYSEKTKKDIGFYGVGGKAAMAYLGRSLEVTCSSQDSDVEHHVVDPNWETHEEDEWKKFKVETRKATTGDGYFKVRVTNLKREVNASALTTKLGDIYRPLLLEDKVAIYVNGKKVEPLQIKYSEDHNFTQPPSQVQTRFGDWIHMRVGLLEEGQRIKPGIRCYYRGRLIEDEQFFGHPTPAQLPQASRLIGEAHLDFCKVTSNKASFVHSDVQWDHASRRIHDVLRPWYEKLAKVKLETKNEITQHEREAAKQMKRLIEHVLATTQLLTRDMLPGESSGRLPPTPTHRPRPLTLKSGVTPKEKTGQTAPPLEAIAGIDTIKRWGAMHNWEVVSMGATDKRSDVVDENGRKCIKINADHPLYQASKKAGEAALDIYIAETSILKIAEIVKENKSITEFRELADQLTREFGAVYQARRQRRS